MKSNIRIISVSILLVAALAFGFTNYQQVVTQNKATTAVAQAVESINFVSWEKAQDLTKTKPRKIFVDIYTPWCGPCKVYSQRMQDPLIANYLNEKYYAIKFNGESGDTVRFGDKIYTNPKFVTGAFRNAAHELTIAFGVQAYPTTLVFDENFVLIQQLSGAFDKLTLDQILHYFGEDNYKTQKWEDFQKEYKSPFSVAGP